MRRCALLLTTLLAAAATVVGCSAPTGPSNDGPDRIAMAKAALEAASQSGPLGKIAIN